MISLLEDWEIYLGSMIGERTIPYPLEQAASPIATPSGGTIKQAWHEAVASQHSPITTSTESSTFL